MKVLQINTVYGTGSTGRIAHDLQEFLIGKGHECLVCYGRGKKENNKFAFKASNKAGIYLHALLSRITDRQGLYSTLSTQKLIKKIKEFKPDIIHLHNIHGYYLNYRKLFKFLADFGVPVVWTLHDCWAFTGHCAHFDYVGCRKWETHCAHCPQKKAYPASYLFDNSNRNFRLKKEYFCSLKNAVIVTPSEWLANKVKQSFLNKYYVRVIRNGVDTAIFRPTESDIKSRYDIHGKKIVLGVANVWNDKKGYGDFIALSEVLDCTYQVVLVGVTDEQKKSLPKSVFGIKRTQSIKELAELYSCAKVFVNLTYEDTYPTTNIEAKACGTPVITYRTGGSVESASEDLIAEKGDIAGIKKLIEALPDGKQEIKESVLDKRDSFEEYLLLYNEVMHG